MKVLFWFVSHSACHLIICSQIIFGPTQLVWFFFQVLYDQTREAWIIFAQIIFWSHDLCKPHEVPTLSEKRSCGDFLHRMFRLDLRYSIIAFLLQYLFTITTRTLTFHIIPVTFSWPFKWLDSFEMKTSSGTLTSFDLDYSTWVAAVVSCHLKLFFSVSTFGFHNFLISFYYSVSWHWKCTL